MSAGPQPGAARELVLGTPTFGEVTHDIATPLERPPGRPGGARSSCCLGRSGAGDLLIGYTMVTGIGVWGLNRTVGWGFDITNFVFWVGIGHAGTLISAILLLLPAALAHLDRPRGRGDDDLRGHVRRDLPAHPHGPAVARVLGLPLPEHARPALGQLPLAARVGRLRDLDVLHGVAPVLVRRADPRPRDDARPGARPAPADLRVR